MTLSKTQEHKLKEIVNDKCAIGPFSGMITNIVFEHSCGVDHAIEKALEVRLRLEELAKPKAIAPPPKAPVKIHKGN